jgi:anti-anti-sigma factor
MSPAAASDPHSDASGARIPPAFAIEELPGPPGVAVLALVGEMDIAAAARFAEHIDRTIDGAAKALVLDLAEVVFIDSSMLKELLRAQAEIGHRGGEVTLAALQPAVQRLLEITRTSELFRIAGTRTAALEAFA